uniref:Uncharacterized protein n=1 Tax=Romanomermis culicivorax TaxID=13658 RepID=A0A915JQX0_ROMCU
MTNSTLMTAMEEKFVEKVLIYRNLIFNYNETLLCHLIFHTTNTNTLFQENKDCSSLCRKISREAACSKIDNQCWRKCTNATLPTNANTSISIPKNISLEYSKKDILLANISWDRVPGADGYVIQFVEIDGEKTDLADQSSYT